MKQEDGGYVVASPGTRNDIMMKFGHLIKNLRGPATPMSDINMRDVGTGAPLSPPERAQYVSLCMSLMFQADDKVRPVIPSDGGVYKIE